MGGDGAAGAEVVAGEREGGRVERVLERALERRRQGGRAQGFRVRVGTGAGRGALACGKTGAVRRVLCVAVPDGRRSGQVLGGLYAPPSMAGHSRPAGRGQPVEANQQLLVDGPWRASSRAPSRGRVDHA